MIISFDIDGTIEGFENGFDQILSLMKILMKSPDLKIKIVTARSRDVWVKNHFFSDWLKINFNYEVSSVIFTDGNDKAEVIDLHNIDLHFDDDEWEVYQINKKCKGKAILVNFYEESQYYKYDKKD